MSTDPADLTTDLLDQPPSHLAADDLEQRLTRTPESPRARKVTRVLGVALVAALGFAGGAWVQGRDAAATGRSASGLPGGFPGTLPSGFPSGAAVPGAGASASPSAGAGTGTTAAGATTGEVVLVDGAVVYVRTADGTLVRVTTTGSTRVLRTTTSSLAKLAKGDAVVVTGTAGTDGAVAATSITSTPDTSTP